MGAPTSKSVTLRPKPGGGTTKSVWTCGGIGRKKKENNLEVVESNGTVTVKKKSNLIL
jgi:hypothetical protein